jgi:hypothetical protein
LGLLSGLGRFLAWACERPEIAIAGTRAIVESAVLVAAFGAAGLITARFGRLLAALALERIDAAGHASAELVTQAARAVEALGRIVAALERGGIPPPASNPSQAGREQALAEIEHALHSDRWAEAQSLLQAFKARFPDDPTLQGLKEGLAVQRRRATEGRMAELEAARQVNDPERVLELYDLVGHALEGEEKSHLERELARWFLDLIHRRLRTTRIQPEVVALATRVAETFGTTVEGASLRAALPTLRRSVGLCPRCARPYTGSAAACPQCLAAGRRPAGEIPAGRAGIRPGGSDHEEPPAGPEPAESSD